MASEQRPLKSKFRGDVNVKRAKYNTQSVYEVQYVMSI